MLPCSRQMAWNSSLGAELCQTKTFCPKHSLHRAKEELVANIVPWLYNVERSLSVLWCKWDKGRKEVWTWKKVPRVSSPGPWPLPKGSPAQCACTEVPHSELSVQGAQEFPWKISERKHSINKKRKISAFSQNLKILCLTGNSPLSVSPTRGASWCIFKLFLERSIKRKVRSQL